VDGTLLEFAATPDGIRVDAALANLLCQASYSLGGAIALVSGRSIAELDRLFAPQTWPAAGIHGLERRDAAGGLHSISGDATTLRGARAMLDVFANEHAGVVIEDKGVSLAVHFRQAPELEERLNRVVCQLARDLGEAYDVLPGACVLELKPRGATKGQAIKAFLGEAPFAGRMPFFAGDDCTDLDGFAVVERAGGLSISVGDRVRGRLRLSSPAAFRRFLAEFLGVEGTRA
jgi:trehalose 6-phosphate phosphatase